MQKPLLFTKTQKSLMCHLIRKVGLIGALHTVAMVAMNCSISENNSPESAALSSELVSSSLSSSVFFISSSLSSHGGSDYSSSKEIASSSSMMGVALSSSGVIRCFAEGIAMPFVSATNPVTMPRQNLNKCCDGLTEVIPPDFLDSNLDTVNFGCLLPSGAFSYTTYCVHCGDGICSGHEHPCSCPEDCK